MKPSFTKPMRPPFIGRIVIRNFKSIASCDVELGSLQFLVGRNGSGKSNFLDALAFVRDALEHNSFDTATGIRFGVDQIINRTASYNEKLRIELLDINLGHDMTGLLSFELILDRHRHVFKVVKETCVIAEDGTPIDSYETIDGEVRMGMGKDKLQLPPVASDRLYLQNMTIFPGFRMLYDALRSIRIYGGNHLRDANDILARYGVFFPFGDTVPEILSSMSLGTKKRVVEYLKNIVPSISDVNPSQYGQLWALSFLVQRIGELPSSSISSGTFRALAILVLVLQEREDGVNNFPALVCIEEPETALHARAMAGMLSALEEASEKRQVLVTTHSTEMLDNKEITADKILPVELRGSETVIGRLESVSKEMLNDHLTTAGELLRQNALNPESSP